MFTLLEFTFIFFIQSIWGFKYLSHYLYAEYHIMAPFWFYFLKISISISVWTDFNWSDLKWGCLGFLDVLRGVRCRKEKAMATHSSTLAWKIPWSLVGCSPWGCEELDTTEQLHFHFSLSCIGEGNGNPLQCSCLENPRDGEPGGLPSTGSHRVGHDLSDLAAAAADAENDTIKIFFLLIF